jgi:hypothetical protein
MGCQAALDSAGPSHALRLVSSQPVSGGEASRQWPKSCAGICSGVFRRLGEWLRHSLRALQLKQWKPANTRRWWKNAGMYGGAGE